MTKFTRKRRLIAAGIVLLIFSAVTGWLITREPQQTPFHPWTSLHQAAKTGDIVAAQRALAGGMGVDVRASGDPSWEWYPDYRDALTPLHIAATYGQLDMAQLLIGKGANINARTASEDTPLFLAAENGHSNVIQLLLDHGAKIDPTDLQGQTPLEVASTEATASLLIARGANLKARAQDGFMPLHNAVSRGFLGVTRLLLDKGSDVNAPAASDWKPLESAAIRGDVPMAKLLLDRGADINGADADGLMPLHLAAAEGHPGVVRLLLARGAQISAVPLTGETPLFFAASGGTNQDGGEIGMAENMVLGYSNASADTPPNYLKVARLLLAHGANVGQRTSHGDTPLQQAAMQGNTALVALLLTYHAPLEARDKNGYTPLHWAAFNNFLSAVKLLVAAGAQLDAKTPEGYTPLSMAKGAGNAQVVSFLRAARARG